MVKNSLKLLKTPKVGGSYFVAFRSCITLVPIRSSVTLSRQKRWVINLHQLDSDTKTSVDLNRPPPLLLENPHDPLSLASPEKTETIAF